MTRQFIADTDPSPEYIQAVAEKLLPDLEALTEKESPKNLFILKSTIMKVLVYCNRVDLPVPLEEVVIEMCARQLVDYEKGLSSEKTGVVKRIQRGGFTQDVDTASSDVAIPRGTQFMSDYVRYLNRYRRMKTI